MEGTIRKWLAGVSEPTLERLVALADAGGVHVQWLATGEGPADSAKPAAPWGQVREGIIDIGPYLRQQAHTPVGAQDAEGEPVVNLVLSAYSSAFLIQKLEVDPDHLAIRFVRGDAMAPTLCDGDVVLLDGRDTRVAMQGVYAIMLDGKEPPIICRLQRFPGGLIKGLYDNPAYQSFDIRPGDPVEILGRVVWASRRF